jgi:hypothetical protein
MGLPKNLIGVDVAKWQTLYCQRDTAKKERAVVFMALLKLSMACVVMSVAEKAAQLLS